MGNETRVCALPVRVHLYLQVCVFVCVHTQLSGEYLSPAACCVLLRGSLFFLCT